MKMVWRWALAVIVIAVLAGAGALFVTRRPIDVAVVPSRAIATPSVGMPDVLLSFSILPTATLTVSEGSMYEGGNWLTSRTLNHSAVLICHPHGFVLFDTGVGRDIDSQFKEFPLFKRIALNYRKLQAVADVIAANNPCPGRQMFIIPSHLHWDHAGGIEDLPQADVWIRSDELRQARKGGARQGFLPEEIDAANIRWRPFTFANQAYEQYPQSLDVFGDGSLILVPMTGHTAGSVGLFITTGGRRYFFTGDTTWALEGFTRPANKFVAARAMADLDLNRLEEEIVGVHRLLVREPELIVVPAHDVAAYPSDALYPNWIGRHE
ncbi:MAG: MBL fold metallo-hydrolase [Hyphomonadaceae bacterium]|nr:MBL fold metallo-hydrolase [Hyphomonadaceae bacterium]